MNRREAADYLGVSVRTLERLASDGRIEKGRAVRKTRPAVDFSEDDLKRLKAELAERQPRLNAAEYKQADTVAFRLDPLYVRRLTKLADEQDMSLGEYARHLVIQSIERGSEERFADETKRLREGLADTFHFFLTSYTDASDEEATEFVMNTILKNE